MEVSTVSHHLRKSAPRSKKSSKTMHVFCTCWVMDGLALAVLTFLTLTRNQPWISYVSQDDIFVQQSTM